jgi:hypothetical protein
MRDDIDLTTVETDANATPALTRMIDRTPLLLWINSLQSGDYLAKWLLAVMLLTQLPFYVRTLRREK